jgi:hypothetical protein
MAQSMLVLLRLLSAGWSFVARPTILQGSR